MSTHDPAKMKHSGYIEHEITGAPYIAKCCCSWEGQPRLTMDEAESDLSRHMESQ